MFKLITQMILVVSIQLMTLSSINAEEASPSNNSDLQLTGFLSDFSAKNLPEGITINARNWTRWSQWQYFDPVVPGGDPDYNYFSNRFRFGIKARHKNLTAEASFQYVMQTSLPDDAVGSPGGALGLGAAYFGHNRTTSPDSLYVKYLNVGASNIAGSGISATIGRFDYGTGLEKMSGNAKIDWLKTVRLDARVIGGFGWSLFQRSFDGVKLAWDNDKGRLSVAGFRPTQGGFESDANKHISDINVISSAYTTNPNVLIPNSELQLFHYYFEDKREVGARVDNSGLSSLSGFQDIDIHNLGGHIAGAKNTENGVVDWLVWGIYQTGNWFGQDHAAYGIATELGFQFTGLAWKPWIRLGAYHGSGDDDANDNTHGTFYQMLPTTRKYTFTTSNNLMNNTDYFIQLLLSPLPNLSLRTDVHLLGLAESADRWYQGAGATQSRGTIQGFGGRASGGDDSLGTSVEFTASYQVSKDINLTAFYGHVFGNNVIQNNFADDEDLDFFFVEAAVSF